MNESRNTANGVSDDRKTATAKKILNECLNGDTEVVNGVLKDTLYETKHC